MLQQFVSFVNVEETSLISVTKCFSQHTRSSAQGVWLHLLAQSLDVLLVTRWMLEHVEPASFQ